MTYRYYLKNRPPGIGTIPDNPIYVESYGRILDSPIMKRGAWGCVEYDHELSQEEIYNYELFVDLVVRPKEVHDLISFARDEGIEAAQDELKDRVYGIPLMNYLKAIGHWQVKTGQFDTLKTGLEYLMKSGA